VITTISAAGGDIEFADLGEGDPILYFHGILSGSELVFLLDGSLVNDGFRIIVPHRPGYFGTPLGGRTTAADCADLAAKVLDHLGIARAAVIGTSAGGPPAMAFAIRYPHRTAALVLQCALAHRWETPEWLPRAHRWTLRWLRVSWIRWLLCCGYLFLLRAMARGPTKCLQGWAGGRFSDIQNDVTAVNAAKSFVSSVSGLRGYYNDTTIFIRENVLSQGEIHCPTLLLYDTHDPIVPFCHAESAASSIAGAQVIRLHVGGHYLWAGRDAELMRTVRCRFLKQSFGVCN
jgi:pimeloyl-ACP methyl ester carboxylesterase